MVRKFDKVKVAHHFITTVIGFSIFISHTNYLCLAAMIAFWLQLTAFSWVSLHTHWVYLFSHYTFAMLITLKKFPSLLRPCLLASSLLLLCLCWHIAAYTNHHLLISWVVGHSWQDFVLHCVFYVNAQSKESEEPLTEKPLYNASRGQNLHRLPLKIKDISIFHM